MSFVSFYANETNKEIDYDNLDFFIDNLIIMVD